MIQGNREFYLIEEQKLVYETALALATASTPNNKNVLVVNGGPGTGKTVVAINLLVELTNRDLAAQYVTKNRIFGRSAADAGIAVASAIREEKMGRVFIKIPWNGFRLS